MKVHFKSADQNANTHCCVCGQGFELTWDRKPNSKITDVLFQIQKSLCDHHRDHAGRQAHPQSGVVVADLIPAWNGPMVASAAMTGNAPMYAHSHSL
jgi:hypothetical protein